MERTDPRYPFGSIDATETQIYSFIVKIWLEKSKTDKAWHKWHGHITEVPGGERKYVNDLAQVTAFITSKLELGAGLHTEPGAQDSKLAESHSDTPPQPLPQ
jgi:hypothetical protein